MKTSSVCHRSMLPYLSTIYSFIHFTFSSYIHGSTYACECYVASPPSLSHSDLSVETGPAVETRIFHFGSAVQYQTNERARWSLIRPHTRSSGAKLTNMPTWFHLSFPLSSHALVASVLLRHATPRLSCHPSKFIFLRSDFSVPSPSTLPFISLSSLAPRRNCAGGLPPFFISTVTSSCRRLNS